MKIKKKRKCKISLIEMNPNKSHLPRWKKKRKKERKANKQILGRKKKQVNSKLKFKKLINIRNLLRTIKLRSKKIKIKNKLLKIFLINIYLQLIKKNKIKSYLNLSNNLNKIRMIFKKPKNFGEKQKKKQDFSQSICVKNLKQYSNPEKLPLLKETLNLEKDLI